MTLFRGFHRVVCLLTIGLAVVAISACSRQIIISAVGPYGTLVVLSPDERFTQAIDKGKIIILGDPSPASLIITQHKAYPALEFAPSDGNFAIVRPIQANLMATPYLDWAWNMARHTSAYHGVSIMVGIRAPDGSPNSTTPGLAPSVKGAPKANRIISIRWSQSALERGFLVPHPQSPGNTVIYSARGGVENTGQWWRESLDLSNLYYRSWPQEDMTQANIVFIALIAENVEKDSPAWFSEIRLFR